ncbi:ABC transporter permease [Sediminibacterium ginsengisoli]|uniref:ABC-2 family transporter protein n=1 Tax=Sediminibacterium ginsengisoli TaxID=413434 RepID=A0A1T4N123_9BACT|nr:ABC transporter permease [Sediminibacterium ginsengisoli]SJZ72831.1 hypothetical protein SAMN04488132_10438 [Sediminibacterium ginsengisoli]
MLSLIKIEWLKIKKYPAFWWMLGIVALTYPGINIMFYNVYQQISTSKNMAGEIAKMLLGNPFAFPETWHSVAYFSSHFVILPSILVIMLVTNEYNYKTHRQNIIDGWSRSQFITSKLCDVAIISFIITIVYALVATVFGFYSDSSSAYRWAEQLYYIPLFFIQSFAQLSIAFLLGYLIKKAFIALGIFLFYNLVIENIVTAYFTYKLKMDGVSRLMPFEMSDRILVAPSFVGKFGNDAKATYDRWIDAVPAQIALTVVFTGIIWLICYAVHKKRDL